MTSPNWLRKLFESRALSALAAREKAGRRASSRRARHGFSTPLFEQLEDRTLLSTYSQNFSPGALTQFNNQSDNTFLGASFSPSGSFGSIDHTDFGDFGAQVNVNLTGQAGLNLSFTGTGGTVTPRYNATLNQSFTQPTGFGQVVSFSPQNTNVGINSGSFTTATPSFGYGADVVADLSGSIGGQFAFFKDFSGSYSFNVGQDIPLFAVNENNDGIVSVGGVPIFGASPGLGLPGWASQALGAAQDFGLGQGLQYGISTDPPLKIKTSLTADALKFTQDLQLELGVPQQLGAYKVPKKLQGFTVSAGLDLGSMTEQAPTTTPSSSTPGAGGVLTGSDSGTVAQLSLQVGALAGSLLGLGALGTTSSINLPGGVGVDFTPVSFQLQPTLAAAQTITIQPVSRLTYTFAAANDHTHSIMADVILNGQDIGNQSSVTFTPGQDTVGIRFEGTPIYVKPTWSFAESITNEVDLDADLDATLTVGQLTVHVPGLDPITVGPLYQQQFQFANTKLMTLFDNTTVTPATSVQLFPTTANPSPPQDDSFTIGSTFHTSTAVSTPLDTGASGSLRFAVLSAGVEATPGNPTVIQLGAGTYQLTIAPPASDGTAGSLVVKTGDDLIIKGLGAGQTIIQAHYSGGTNDRLFDVQNGASLTLDGLTLEDGNSADSVVDPGEAGAILGEAGSTIDIEGCTLSHNTAPGLNESPLVFQVDGIGGAVLSNGSLTVRDSTITGNVAVTSGGGITVQGGTLLLEDSTVTSNTLSGGYSDIGRSSVVNSDQGGGLDLEASSATIDGCTFTDNSAGGSVVQANGGAIYIFDDASNQNILIENSTLIHNQATGTFGEGGAIFYFNPLAHLFLVGDTIASNTANGQGGVAATSPQPIVLKNTIVAANHEPSGTADDMNGMVVWSLGNNLIGTTGPSAAPILADHGPGVSGGHLVGITAGFDPKDVLNQDPQLAALADNGGPTRTATLLSGSPALGAGGTTINVPGVITQLPATDQRGYARTVGGQADIGAVEYQHDLAVTSSETFVSGTTHVTYSLTVANDGPDPAYGVELDDILPANTNFIPNSFAGGWTATRVGNTVRFTDNNPLTAGQSATFSFTITPTYTPGQQVIDTATVSTPRDPDTANNSAVLAVSNPTEGNWLHNAVLYHFAGPDAAVSAANFSASVDWGDGTPDNNSLDGTGSVAVVANTDVGGFDVIGSHLYADEGSHTVTVNVTGVQAASMTASLSGQTITGGLPAPLPTPGGSVTNMVMYHFVDPAASQDPASFTPIVSWGDGTLARGAAAGVTVVADPAGGFDVVGGHTFASGVVGAVNLVELIDSRGVAFWGPSLLHLGSQPRSADQITATWGDGNSNTVNGPLGAPPLLVTGNPAGGFDIVGDHAYTSGVPTFSGTSLVTVDDAALTGGAATPPPVLPQTVLNNAVLFHFVDPDPGLTDASDFTATVHWGGEVAVNTSTDGSGAVSVVADLTNGGWNVVGTHTLPVGVGAIRSITVVDSDGRVFYGDVLFHFTDANPLATPADFSATVNWGDGKSNNLTDGDNAVYIVADPAGGFDVLGNHIYLQNIRNGTFSVSVADDGGATASASTPFSVDYALTAGTLTLPAVSNEGDSIAKAVLFHFTDGDSQGAATDFTATVLWGDGTSNSSADKSGTVTVSANTGGGFDVFGAHTFGEVASGAVYGVYIQDVSGATTGASSTSFTVADPSVSATGSLSLSAKENADPGAQTLATFTDPGGAEALADYSASVHWGDGTPDGSGTISYDSTTGTFTVTGDHVYSQAGSDTITVTISHDTSAAVQVTDSVNVAEVAASVTGNSFSLSKVYGQSVSTQTVGTFTDAGGAGPLSGYTPTIDWGDGSTASTGTVGYNTAAPFTFASNLQTGNGPSAVAVADLNGDGNLDLVVANGLDNNVQVFLGNGDGSFKPPVTYSLGAASSTAPAASPTALAIADLGNGHLDIVTANSNTNTVSVLLGDGTGAFGTPTTLTAGANPSAIALADLGNGHVDIVTANRHDNTVSVFLGDGTGAFGKATSFAAGTSPDGLAIGDVNGGGKPDLVVADAVGDSVSVLIGNGDGTFQAPTSVAVGAIPSAVALAHLTTSGHLDIVTANGAGNNVSVLLGNGDGTFQAAVNYAVGTAPAALLVTDANGDGKADIITANNGDNNVSVLAGKGDGTFGAATNYALAAGPTAPVAIAAGDLVGAGVPDLVTANALSGDVTLLLPPYTVTGSHNYSAVSATGTPYQVKVSVAHGGTSADASSGTVAVASAPLTITADDQTMTYGGTLPTLTATFTGLVNGDKPSAVTGLSLSTVSASSHVGSYTITASGGTDSNYTITLNNGTLTITSAALSITADNQGRAYGDPNPTLTATYNGLVNGDKPANLTGTLSVTTTATQTSSPGNYTITASGQSSADYTITYNTGTLTVGQAVLTVTANDASRIYGIANPAFGASYSGFKNGETLATSDVSGNPSLTTTAAASSPVGTYAITPATGSLASNNYSFSFTAGKLTVTPAPLSATGVPVSATAGAPFSGAVATFTNADPFGGASSYTALITWGDGSTSAGTITGTGSTLTVSGTHTYAGAGSDPVSVQISHKLGYTTTATTSATATVTGRGIGVQRGQAASIGFWQGVSGQTLIQSFNGGAKATALGNWLAATLPNVFGAAAGANNLAGKTNTQVAAYYLTLFNVSPPKLAAEVLATALNVYATTSSLGGTAAQAYRFKVDAYGLGASSYNVGANGAAFGVANNSVLNVYQLLQAANAKAAGGVLYGGDATRIALALNVFDGINTAGGL